MSPQEASNNPFGLLLNPERIVQAVEASERLGRLHSRVCRPLDRPLLPARPNDPVAVYDAAIDRASARHTQ